MVVSAVFAVELIVYLLDCPPWGGQSMDGTHQGTFDMKLFHIYLLSHFEIIIPRFYASRIALSL